MRCYPCGRPPECWHLAPLAASLVAEARRRDYTLPTVADARKIATHGVQARIGTEVVTVGKPTFVAEQAPGLTRLELTRGEVAVDVAVDDQFADVIVLRDAVREEAPKMLRDLRKLGI